MENITKETVIETESEEKQKSKRGAPQVKDSINEILQLIQALNDRFDTMEKEVRTIKNMVGFNDKPVSMPTITNHNPDRLPIGVDRPITIKEYEEMQRGK